MREQVLEMEIAVRGQLQLSQRFRQYPSWMTGIDIDRVVTDPATAKPLAIIDSKYRRWTTGITHSIRAQAHIARTLDIPFYVDVYEPQTMARVLHRVDWEDGVLCVVSTVELATEEAFLDWLADAVYHRPLGGFTLPALPPYL